MARTHRPNFFEPSREDAIGVLSTHVVGRIAYSFHDRVDIEPISYVFVDGWIYGRTSEGAKLTTLRHHPWVAFEVDEVRDRFNWISVVVHGTMYFLSDEGSEHDHAAYANAIGLLRGVDASIMTPADATPYRDVLFRIHVNDITARAAQTL